MTDPAPAGVPDTAPILDFLAKSLWVHFRPGQPYPVTPQPEPVDAQSVQ